MSTGDVAEPVWTGAVMSTGDVAEPVWTGAMMSTGDVAEPVWTVTNNVPRESVSLPVTRPQGGK